MSLIEKMKSGVKLSEGERQIVTYLLENPDENLTITELARQTYTSNPTVIRLCKKLGYDGYRSFKMDFVKEMESEKYISETVHYEDPFAGNKSMLQVSKKMASLYKESIDLLMQSVDVKVMETIAKRMIAARRIYIYAIGDSLITAKGFANKLNKLDIYPILANEIGEGKPASRNVKKEDAVLCFSYRMQEEHFGEIFSYLHRKKIPFTVFTANEESSITKWAENKVMIPKREAEYAYTNFYSQLCLQYICDVLYSYIYLNI